MLVDFQLFAIKLGKPLLVQTFAEQLKIIYLPYHSFYLFAGTSVLFLLFDFRRYLFPLRKSNNT